MIMTFMNMQNSSFSPKLISYTELLANLVCDITSRNCVLCCCDNCPGEENLEVYHRKCLMKQKINLENSMKNCAKPMGRKLK